MSTSGYDPNGNGAGGDGLDFLRSMIAEEQPVPARTHRQHPSGSLSIDMGELHVLRSQGRPSTAHGLEAEHYNGDEDVNMLQDIADADDGGSLTSYNPEEDRIMNISSPPSSPVRNANGPRINNNSSSNPSRMQLQLPQSGQSLQISPTKRSEKLDETSPDNRPYLPPAQDMLVTSTGSHPRSISVQQYQHHRDDDVHTLRADHHKREPKRQVSSENGIRRPRQERGNPSRSFRCIYNGDQLGT